MNERQKNLRLLAGQRWVSGAGYRWVKTRTLDHHSKLSVKPALVITANKPTAGTWRRRYFTFSDDAGAAFQEFAELQLVPEKTLKFADQYGLLGDHVMVPDPPIVTHHSRMKRKAISKSSGETWETWKTAIIEMKRAVQLWKLCVENDDPRLHKLFEWSDDFEEGDSPAWYYVGDSAPEYVGMQRKPDDPHGREVPPGEVYLAATTKLMHWINAGLANKTSVSLMYTGDGDYSLKMTAKNLLGAMWLQFAHAVAGHKEVRTCRSCGAYFEVAPDADARTGRRQFCSDACKSRDYRMRKESKGGK